MKNAIPKPSSPAKQRTTGTVNQVAAAKDIVLDAMMEKIIMWIVVRCVKKCFALIVGP